MASVTGAPTSLRTLASRLPRRSSSATGSYGLKTAISLRTISLKFQPVRLRLRVSCAARKETVEKVCAIVRKQLVLPANSVVSGESKFSDIGADSLDTVEIVMGLEEEFGITVAEDSAQNINTVQDAADLIEKIIENHKA